jgi:DNA-dependent RNA polymerase auxiliary subunit epsilon
MRKEINCGIMLFCMVWVIMCLPACYQSVGGKRPAIKHMAEVHKNGCSLYVDRVDSRQVMKADTGNAFVAYKIGFIDSLQGDKKYEQERNVYYDFKMVNDWKAVVGRDSILPIHFQPVTGLNSMNKEGILVFEMPAGKYPNTLVYDDSFGDWQKQIIALNPTLK